MSSVALAIEKLRASGNNIKLVVPHTITNRRNFATRSRTYNDSLYINGDIPSKFTLAFVKSATQLDHGQIPPMNF